MEYKTAHRWRLWGQVLLDLLFPPRCLGCRQSGMWICQACLEQVGRTEGLFCTHCGQPISGVESCIHCRNHEPVLAAVEAPFLFEGVVRQAVHALKYRGRRVLAEPLGSLLAGFARSRRWPAATIVPVPLHARRERDRGYNQSALLGRVLAEGLGWPLLCRSLFRWRHTDPQVGLDRRARRENVRDAFRWQASSAPPRRVLLLDDVYTTGATMAACAQALRAAGAEEIWGLAVARPRPGRIR